MTTIESQITQTIQDIISQVSSSDNEEFTILTGESGMRSFALHELAYYVYKSGIKRNSINKNMSRKDKKKRYKTISYRKKHHPDFGCPLSIQNLRKIGQKLEYEEE